MKNFLSILFTLTLLISCNKNQVGNRKIEGKWQYIGQTITEDGQSVYYPQPAEQKLVYNFNNCKYSHNEFCTLIITNSMLSEDVEIQSDHLKVYRITSDSNLLEIKNNTSDTIVETYLIHELFEGELTLISHGLTSDVSLSFIKLED